MRIILMVFIIFSSLYALSAKDAYQKAFEYESKGDIKNALKWYKKSAKLSLSSVQDENSSKNLPTFAQDEVKSYKKTTMEYEEYFSPYKNRQTQETVGQIITGLFGLQPYHTNYLMPVVYDHSDKKGRKNFETEFQISFKKTFYEDLLGFDEKYAFGYSQTSWWQTFKDSSPFRETNYRPEIFVYGFYGKKDFPLKGYQFGLLHESNGQDFGKSRSWNRLYLRTFLQVGDFFIVPRVWYRLPERDKKSINDDKGDDNPDIEDFLGYGDLQVSLPWRKHLFTAKLRNNLKFNSNNRGSFEFEWTFPLWSKSFFGYIKYFTGYGSSLEDYNSHSDRIGVGFAVSR